MSTKPLHIPSNWSSVWPFVWVLALLAQVGCGEATHVLVESHPILVTPSDALPKNLVSHAELIVAAPDGGVTVVVERVAVTVRQDVDEQHVATVSVSGVLRANVPADILLLEVLLEPAAVGAPWVEHADVSVPFALYPTQLAAYEEGEWHWQTRATTDASITGGLVVRVRLVYEVLL
jgi:hypothetical protein